MTRSKEQTPKGITFIGRKKDSFKKLYESMKPVMERVIKSLPTDKELQKVLITAMELVAIAEHADDEEYLASAKRLQSYVEKSLKRDKRQKEIEQLFRERIRIWGRISLSENESQEVLKKVEALEG